MIQVVREPRNYLLHSGIHSYIHDGTWLLQWNTSASDIRSLVKFHLLLDTILHTVPRELDIKKWHLQKSMKPSSLKVEILRSCASYFPFLSGVFMQTALQVEDSFPSLQDAFLANSLNSHIFIF